MSAINKNPAPTAGAAPTAPESPARGISGDTPHDVDEDALGVEDDTQDDGDDDDSDLGSIGAESLYDDILETSAHLYQHGAAPSAERCTKEESERLRARLREVGVERFVEETLDSDAYTPLKLLSAFRVAVPPIFDADERGVWELLGLAMYRELSHRVRLPRFRTIDDAAELLKTSKNIMVITGAGISTNLGIPDFRSRDTGFYTKLRNMGFEDPESLFNLEDFDMDPSRFYSLAGELIPELNRWSPTHQFIRLLQDKGKLLRNYTQNIDNVESYAGIQPEKVIHCHGSWRTATCRKCKTTVPGEQIFDALRRRVVATCQVCALQFDSLKRKRPAGVTKPRKKTNGHFEDDDEDEDDDFPTPGVMKPDITFFGESLPKAFYDSINGTDRPLVDLVIVIGTSMKVAPVSEIPNHVRHEVPAIYISRDPIRHIEFDINLLGNCDTIVAEMCRRAGWELKHTMLPAPGSVPPPTLAEHAEHEWAFTVTEQVAPSNTLPA